MEVFRKPENSVSSLNWLYMEGIYSIRAYLQPMKDKGTQKGKSRKVESSDAKTAAGTPEQAAPVRDVPMTSKEKIAANQKNKRRR